jgi:hypothetical protein
MSKEGVSVELRTAIEHERWKSLVLKVGKRWEKTPETLG